MAKLLKKHFGLGKKGTPLPPNKDYVSPKSSSSVQELLTHSPTIERSPTTVSTFDVSDDFLSLGSKTLQPHSISYGTDELCGSSTLGKVRDLKDRHLVTLPIKDCDSYLVSSSDIHESDSKSEEDNLGVGDSGNNPEKTEEPQILDEYSDPFDLRKQIQETPELLGSIAPVSPMQSVGEDDYSVPYEVKKLMKEKRLKESGLSKKNSDSLKGGVPKEEQASNETRFSSKNSENKVSAMQSEDVRPKEEYDEPWEWSQTHNVLIDHVSGAGDRNIPRMTKQAPIPGFTNINAMNFEEVVVEAEASVCPKSAESSSNEIKTSNIVNTDSNEDNSYEVEYENVKDDYDKPAPGATQFDDEEYERYTHLREDFKKKMNVNSHGSNYEEPWDLTSTQKDLEDRIKAHVSHGDYKSVSNSKKSPPAVARAPDNSVTDCRNEEGYDKPWDWKPHKKDDRGPDGYEKPWDWKPHQKDDRPPEEYEKPWEDKMHKFEQEISPFQDNRASMPSGSNVECKMNASKLDDSRPNDEYDDPWDHKQKMLAERGRESDSGAWSGEADAVDGMMPLEEQSWYHGAISRVDAERLLRKHSEGSYLVRMSESNKKDFSLSLKSARGFMHMKIVSRDNKFILGQFSQPFDSIPLMIHHYSMNKLPIKGAEHMSLLHPVVHELL